ncbi:MAG: glycosyltransferase family 4 protein [Halorientalis sp.]
MRILRVAQTYYPDVAGGGAYHVHAMSRDQTAMGHDVTVLTLRRSADAPRQEGRDGYTVRRFEPTTSLLGNDVSAGLAREIWNADGFDVVHAHSHLYFATNIAALKRRLGETPLAITNHGLYSQSAPRWLFDLYLRTLGRATFDSADVVFCYTDTDRQRVREFGVDSEIAVVSNGIDRDRFSSEGVADERVRGDPAILFVGRLVEGKRPENAVAAFEHLVESYPSAHLTVVGEGPRRSTLETQVTDAGLDDSVSFLGHVEYDRMPAVYRGADVLVLPSAAEGFPRTVMEALATGTPVVATALDQLSTVTGRGLRTVPLDDVPSLAAAIDDVISESANREELAGEGRALVSERYDWNDTVRETTDRLAALVE